MKRKNKRNKHTTVRTYVETKEKIFHMAKAQSMSPARFLEELINELFPLCEFKEIKILYEGRLDTHTLNIMVCPKATYTLKLAPLKILKEHNIEVKLEGLDPITEKESEEKNEKRD